MRIHCRRLLQSAPALLGVLLAAGGAAGQELAERVGVCAAVPEPGRRLACYDGLARTLSAPVKPAPRRWHTQLGTERPEEAGSVVLSTLSVKGRGRHERPIRLVISCRPGRDPLVGIDWDLPVGTQQVPVRTAIDDRPPAERVWSITNDSTSTVELWNSPAILRALVHGRRYVARLTLPDNAEAFAEFSVAGLEEELRPHRAACGLPAAGG